MEDIKLTFRKPVQMSTEMKDALAHCYNMPGFRKYLENMLNALIILAATKRTTEIEIAENRGAIGIVEKILKTSKSCYYDFEVINKIKK